MPPGVLRTAASGARRAPRSCVSTGYRHEPAGRLQQLRGQGAAGPG